MPNAISVDRLLRMTYDDMRRWNGGVFVLGLYVAQQRARLARARANLTGVHHV